MVLAEYGRIWADPLPTWRRHGSNRGSPETVKPAAAAVHVIASVQGAGIC